LSFNKVGGVQVAQGDLAGALKSFRDSHAIRERLATSDPGNAGCEHGPGRYGAVVVSYCEVTLSLSGVKTVLAIIRAKSNEGAADQHMGPRIGQVSRPSLVSISGGWGYAEEADPSAIGAVEPLNFVKRRGGTHVLNLSSDRTTISRPSLGQYCHGKVTLIGVDIPNANHAVRPRLRFCRRDGRHCEGC
jgi:hypothetical protein